MSEKFIVYLSNKDRSDIGARDKQVVMELVGPGDGDAGSNERASKRYRITSLQNKTMRL